MSYKSLGVLLMLLCLTGCQKYYVTIKKEPITKEYLASTFVGSPDPLQDHPPRGQILFVEWSIDSQDLLKKPFLVLEMVYGDWSEERLIFPIEKRRGLAEYTLEGKKYTKKEGFFSYRALIETKEGEVLAQWAEQMWTPVIKVDHD